MLKNGILRCLLENGLQCHSFELRELHQLALEHIGCVVTSVCEWQRASSLLEEVLREEAEALLQALQIGLLVSILRVEVEELVELVIVELNDFDRHDIV